MRLNGRLARGRARDSKSTPPGGTPSATLGMLVSREKFHVALACSAELAGPDYLHRLPNDFGGALLHSHLHNPLMLARRGHGRPPFGDVMTDRLLAIDVFPRLAGENGLNGVPMIRGSDDDGVNVFPIEDLAEIDEWFRTIILALLNKGRRLIKPLLINVADGGGLNVRQRHGDIEQLLTAAAAADKGDGHLLVRSAGVGRIPDSFYGCGQPGGKGRPTS